MIRTAYVVPVALSLGCVLSLLLRAALVPAIVVVCVGALARPHLALALLLAAGGWWWGTERVRALERSVLAAHVGTDERALVETQEPVHVTRFAVRVTVVVQRWGTLRLRERALLELPLGRAPPQGSRLQVLGTLRDPGDLERTRLRRHGVHIVLRASAFRVVGARHSAADRLHAWLVRAAVPGLAGE